jgi:hypothetical protein
LESMFTKGWKRVRCFCLGHQSLVEDQYVFTGVWGAFLFS